MSALRIAGVQVERLKSLAAAGYPHESCGVLIGRRSGEITEVAAVTQARNLNLERAHDRYELDPQDMVQSDQVARRQGLEVVGVWHSHPDHPARPSELDRAGAWEAWSYIIVSVTRSGIREIRAWRLDGSGDFVEEELIA